jgi:hypothetical protein
VSVSTISIAGTSPVVNAMALFKQANGEYSATSVATDPTDATKLGLIKLQDGNYGPLLFPGSFLGSSSAAATSSSGVQAVLNSLVLGG